MQQQIKSFEDEAAELERKEAELLAKLQQTHFAEREHIKRYENAMIESGISKKVR